MRIKVQKGPADYRPRDTVTIQGIGSVPVSALQPVSVEEVAEVAKMFNPPDENAVLEGLFPFDVSKSAEESPADSSCFDSLFLALFHPEQPCQVVKTADKGDPDNDCFDSVFPFLCREG